MELEDLGNCRGRADPILLVHGFGGGRRAWGPDILQALGRDRRVLAVDLLGHGDSDDPSAPGRVALAPVLDDLERVLDLVGVGSCAWVGYSMGGRIALAAAVLRPERVARLALESASPGLATQAERGDRLERDQTLARTIEGEGVEAWVEAWEENPLFAARRTLSPDVRASFLALRRANRPASLASWLRGLGTGTQPSFWDRLDEVRAPALLVTGAADARYTRIARAMAAEMPRARHEVVAGAGHTVHLENPTAWISSVIPFLDEESGP
ncbi:MAG: 2-succinyl-6-hydroxy-2,4-cyclohexadiene-1-carboxylate synthase [Gemmatimonadetes bacterium]|nr:2-succinyl-6-hydroxy-2,4-cyclohexadiene-1-carboxylate synthase [Gemmatimonadota bacterium]